MNRQCWNKEYNAMRLSRYCCKCNWTTNFDRHFSDWANAVLQHGRESCSSCAHRFCGSCEEIRYGRSWQCWCCGESQTIMDFEVECCYTCGYVRDGSCPVHWKYLTRYTFANAYALRPREVMNFKYWTAEASVSVRQWWRRKFSMFC